MKYSMAKRIFSAAAAIFFIMTSSAVFAGETAEHTVDLIGHRGYSARYPENTMPAFKGAFTAGFDGNELDVWESDTGDILVFHDYTTGRMCLGKSNKIWHVNLRSRKNRRYWIPYKNANLLIPTLQDVLKLAERHPGMLLIHIKSKTGKYRLSNAGVSKIIRLIKKYNVQDRAVVFCSSEKDMKRFAKKGIRIGRQTSSLKRKTVNTMVKWLKKYKGDTLVITYTKTMRQKDFGQGLVDYCHKNGINIGTYYANTADDLDFLTSINADFAMSDWYLPGMRETSEASEPAD